MLNVILFLKNFVVIMQKGKPCSEAETGLL